MNNKIKYFLLIIMSFLISISLVFIPMYIVNEYYFGDYKINKIYISSEFNGKVLCNQCLFIEFYEGCNRYKTYYFENQHQYDNRLNIGDVVDIKFNKYGFVKSVNRRIKYANKC